ncbi:MAG: extracellular solute-binding protein [Oscillospiraceae bacterium]|nr:extracellular solute-binding protein [Oscillospiraceae bacterium]
MKKGILLGAIFLFLVCSGCAGGEEGTEGSSSAASRVPARREVITVVTDLNREGTEWLARLISGFNAGQEGIRVELTVHDSQDTFREYLSSFGAAGLLPDLIGGREYAMLCRDGLYRPITGELKEDRAFASLEPELQTLPLRGEECYGAVFRMDSVGYFANAELVKDATGSAPTYPMTVESFLSAIEAVTEKTEAFGLDSEEHLIQWYAASRYRQYGFTGFDGTRFYLTGKVFREGLEIAGELYADRASYTSAHTAATPAQQEEAFRRGEVAFLYGRLSDLSRHGELPFRVRFCGIPGGRPFFEPSFLGISVNCGKVAAAYRFLQYLCFSEEGAEARLGAEPPGGVVSLPLRGEERFCDRFFSRLNLPGLKSLFARREEAAFSGLSLLPGYRYLTETARIFAPDDTILTVPEAFRALIRKEQDPELLETLHNDLNGIYALYLSPEE